MTENPPKLLKNQIENGVKTLRQGGIVAFPTDTVYGLGVPIFNENAVRRVFEVKQRPFNIALPVLITSIVQLKDITVSLSKLGICLAQKFWPGALTLVLFKSNKVPGIVTANEKTIAVRMSSHVVPVTLINSVGTPIIGTSANMHGKPSPVTATEVRTQLGDNVDLIIDGGPCPGGVESTIVDLTKDNPVILREGPISRDEIQHLYKII